MQPVKKVHVSFDDVYLGESSEFDKFFQRLKLIHNIYGAKFSLYTFDVPENIEKNTLVEEASDWLKFSYHGSNEPFDTISARDNYIKRLNHQLHLLRRMGGDSCLSNTVRLHYFYADSLMLKVATSNGLTTFLSADSPKRISYSLDSCSNEHLYMDGHLSKDGNKYYRTDLRLEYTKLLDCISNGNLSDTTLVIFTHRNKFSRMAEMKMHILMIFLRLNNYEFVTDL